MGTSSSHSGPGDSPGLLPKWALAPEETSGSPDQEGDQSDGDETGDDGIIDSESNQNPIPTQSQTLIPTRHWQTAKAGMTRYANSGGGASRLRSAGAGYVRAKGGARKSASSAITGRSSSRNLGGFLSTLAGSGIRQAFEKLGLGDVVGQPSDRVLARLVDALAPAGSTREEAAARNATIETLEYLYETVVGTDGDFTALESMDAATVEDAIERSVSGYIYNRWLDDLGASIEKGAVTEAIAVKLEREVRTYVVSCVKLELGDKKILNIAWDQREGQQLIERVYRDAYSLLEIDS